MRYILFLSAVLICQLSFSQTIAEIQGQEDDSPYLDQVVTTTGIVTASFTTGSNSTSAYFIQDGTGPRSGIYVYDGVYSPEVGDEVEITATVDEFFELTELVDVTSLEVLSQDNPLPDPITLSTGDANSEDYESMLVQIESALCTNPDIGFGEFELNDGTGAVAVDDLIYLYQAAQGISYTVTAPLYYSFGNFKLVPRGSEDIEIANEIFFTALPYLSEIGQTSLEITWETNIESTAELEFGETDGYELGSITDEVSSSTHSILLEDLQPGTIYFLNATSESETAAIDHDFVVATASTSSGEVKVYFNHIVDESFADEEVAVWTPSIKDTIISYIDSAKHTIDVTMYDAENQEIIEALNEAKDRGVIVRFISDEGTENPVFENLDPEIPLHLGNADGLMHNKFFVFDREVADSCWVMTGSTNHTEGNLGWDFNNLICIQDQSLARAYTLEFEEMWGGSADLPNPSLAKFGEEKLDNTPHQFLINGIEAELYFSPSDGVTNKIADKLNQAQESIEFAILVFTENALGDAILNAHENGLEVRGIIDYVEFNGSEYEFLLDNGVDVMDYQNADGSQWPDGPTLHHKYAIIDRENEENATLITGSHNWTASANSIHDENTLILKSDRLANLYYQEFMARWQGMFTSTEDITAPALRIYPNPANQEIFVESGSNLNGPYEIVNLKGQLIQKGVMNQNSIDISSLRDGLYLVVFPDETGPVVNKLLVE